jgi:hypothetical protein
MLFVTLCVALHNRWISQSQGSPVVVKHVCMHSWSEAMVLCKSKKQAGLGLLVSRDSLRDLDRCGIITKPWEGMALKVYDVVQLPGRAIM